MQEDRKVLFLAALIIVVAIVSFNLNITGKVTSCDKSMSIVVGPSVVEFGKYDASKIINVAFKEIGNRGIDSDIKLYKANGVRVENNALKVCKKYICYDDVTSSYRVSRNLVGGEYYFEASRDRGDCKYKSNTFKVIAE